MCQKFREWLIIHSSTMKRGNKISASNNPVFLGEENAGIGNDNV